MAKKLIIFTKEELLKLLDGSPVRMEPSEDLPEIIFYSEDGLDKFEKILGGDRIMYNKNDRDLAEDKKEKDNINTVTCEFHCVSSENDFKVGFNGGDKESNNAW